MINAVEGQEGMLAQPRGSGASLLGPTWLMLNGKAEALHKRRLLLKSRPPTGLAKGNLREAVGLTVAGVDYSSGDPERLSTLASDHKRGNTLLGRRFNFSCRCGWRFGRK